MDRKPPPPPKPKALPSTTAVGQKHSPPALKDGMKKAPASQPTAPGASATNVPERMSAWDMLTLAESNLVRSKDGHAEQELKDGAAPANRDLATSEDFGKSQERILPTPTAMIQNTLPPSREHDKTTAPPFQSTAPSAPATVIPKRMSPFDMLRLAELGILRPKDDSVQQELKDDPRPAVRSQKPPTPPLREPVPPPPFEAYSPPSRKLESFTYSAEWGYDRPRTPSQKHDKRETHPFSYSPPGYRAPKRYDPFDTARELEAVQSNLSYGEQGLRKHPPPVERNLADPFSTRTTTRFNPPPPRLQPGEVKAPALRPTAQRVNPFDAIDEEDALKSSGGHVEIGKSAEQLKDTQSRSAESKVYNTWEHYLQDLKPAWNGNRRLAIDVPRHGVESTIVNTSWASEVEARLVCDLVKGAIEAEVPANGVALTCANFLGVVVYEAQGGTIAEEMFRFRINKPGKRVTVDNTRAIKDAEGDIVLLCFARNIPDKPFDLTLSRGKQSLVVIGNIRAWAQERINANRLVAKKKSKMGHFGSYIKDIIEQKDAISYGDVQRFLNGEDIVEAEFPKLLMPKLSSDEDKAEKKARKKRHSKPQSAAMHPIDQGALYYDAQTFELRSKHGASFHVLPVSDIPDDLKYRESAKGQEYDKAFDTITARYNGTDGLSKKEATHPADKKWVITGKPAAIISFDSESRAAFGSTPATNGPYFGQGLQANPGRNESSWIKSRFVMNSQHPAIAIILSEEGQNDVICYFYANSIQRDLEKNEVRLQIHGSKEAGGRHEHIGEVADLRRSGDLIQVDVYPWGPDKVMPNDNGVQPAKAAFTGITEARISELVKFADGNHPAEWDAMSDRDKVVVFLHQSRHFSVFRYWPSGGTAPVDSLRQWMNTAMWATAKYGFHWFYQMQSSIRVDAADFPWKDATVPRWLAKTMAIEFDREGKLVMMRPDEWYQFLAGDKFLFPTPVAGAFAHPLAIFRVGEIQSSILIKKAFSSENFRQKGTFKEHPEQKGIFIVAIWPDEMRMWTTDPSLKPTPGARVVIEVPTPAFEHDGETHRMMGEISQDIFGTKAGINAIVRGPADLLEQSHLYSRPADWSKDDFRVCLQREDGPPPARRHLAAVE